MLVAAFIVKSMSLELLRWLVVCVVLYAALLMLKYGHWLAVGRWPGRMTWCLWHTVSNCVLRINVRSYSARSCSFMLEPGVQETGIADIQYAEQSAFAR